MRHGPRRIGLVSLVVSHSGFSALFDDNDDAPAKRREIAGAFAAHALSRAALRSTIGISLKKECLIVILLFDTLH